MSGMVPKRLRKSCKSTASCEGADVFLEGLIGSGGSHWRFQGCFHDFNDSLTCSSGSLLWFSKSLKALSGSPRDFKGCFHDSSDGLTGSS